MMLKLLKSLLALTLLGILVTTGIVGGAYWYIKDDLPSTENLRQIKFQVPLRVFSADHKLIAQFGEKKRIPTAYSDTPQMLINAFLAAEDDNFFKHPGIDLPGLIRASVALAVTGKRRQGGSTITMQVARNFYLTRERTYLRKIREIFLAIKIEQELSKPEILELYLNKIYLGHRAYGIGAAAQIYYGKHLAKLSLAESAMLAGLPKAPSVKNPISNPEQAKDRRNYVLRRMLDTGHISQHDYQQTIRLPITAKRHQVEIELEAPYVAEMVRNHMIKKFGTEAYTGGYTVHTTIHSELQLTANLALRKALESYDQRHGWRNAEHHFDTIPDDSIGRSQILDEFSPISSLLPALVISVDEKTFSVYLQNGDTQEIAWGNMNWARKYISVNKRTGSPKTAGDIVSIGDVVRIQKVVDEEGAAQWRLSQVPAVSGALVSLDPHNGALLALTGGYNYYLSKFNRATQALRQPGSGFKAFIYSAALEAGYTAASLINDAPVVFTDPSLEESWRPQNYSGKFFGLTRLRLALTKSRNLVSIRLMRNMGIAYALKHIERFGFDSSKLPANLTLALGSGVVTPWQMARAYATLANGGYLIDPYFIDKIEVQPQILVYQAQPAVVCPSCKDPLTEQAQEAPIQNLAPQVITAENSFLMYSMMQDVIQHGTGRKARILERADIAGKTGTSNDQRDAWFNGYNQSIVTNVWVGFDNNSKLGRGEVGGKAALPVWIDYMRVALDGLPENAPELPVNMVTVKIDPDTGLRASAGQSNAIFEYFRPEFVPAMAVDAVLPANGNTDKPEANTPAIDDLF